ncbi:MAG: family 10 glycosylhydrolase [Lachnospirales bacterium]
MKRFLKIFSLILAAFSIIFNNLYLKNIYADSSKDFRGVWVSTVYRADFPSVQNDAEAQKKEFIEKLDELESVGINAIVVQIRPKGDALYQSEINPWSDILTGNQGQYPGYDPLEFMIEEAHKRDMEFHAWLNSYRITTKGTDLTTLAVNNMARIHPDWVITYNGAMYYNPEKTEVKEYIKNTVGEIIKNYNVDAIHFDDYFYPADYALSSGEGLEGTEANARREHINDMVRLVSEEIKSVNPEVEFGISPMGIWKNSSSDVEGSNTTGKEGYYSVFGDAKAWINNGWVDYIVPQLYWEQGNKYADYETLVKWWSNVTQDTDVKLYIGQGIYKDEVAKEITEQLNINEKYDVQGSIFFSAKDIFEDRQGVATSLKNYYFVNEISDEIQDDIETGDVAKENEENIEINEEVENEAVIENTTTKEDKIAYAVERNILVNNLPISLEVYTIDDYTYFKLRDIAYYINGTEKQFEVLWNEEEEAIYLQSGFPYSGTVEGGAISSDSIAKVSDAKLYINGEEKSVSAYNINNYTYYKLRDIAENLDIGITWNSETSTIGIDTSIGYN